MDGTLYDWAVEATAALELPPEARWVGERDTVSAVLDLARDVAQGATRPAAPIGAFLAGVAVGLHHAEGPEALERVRARLATTLSSADEGAD
jgi:hypothetical protein